VKRLETLSQELAKQDIAHFAVSNIYNVRYLSGFSGSTGWLLVSPDKTILITDFRYREQAEGEVYRGVEITVDSREALAVVCETVGTLKGRIGFESGSLTYAAYEKLKAACGDPVPVSGLVEDLRKTKDPNEICSITRAVEITDAVFEEVVERIRAGMTEVDLAADIDYHLRKKSSEVPAFKTIVASGEHSSLPHAAPSMRVIREGDLVKMDFGAIWDGYCADLTRTVVVGKASEKVKEVYGIVLEAQKLAIAGIKAGLRGNEADRLARDHIEGKGYGENFGHGLGHGVGLEVHEEPRLSKKSEKVLEPGMVVTVEPGIYLPGWGGVRIEDIVVVEEDGCRDLTSASKVLHEVGGKA
jgi:Xaa-Pro aminopeptidase